MGWAPRESCRVLETGALPHSGPGSSAWQRSQLLLSEINVRNRNYLYAPDPPEVLQLEELLYLKHLVGEMEKISQEV